MRRVISLAEGVAWVQETAHILVVDERQGKAHLLQGEEMAIWDWLMLGYPLAKLTHMSAELRCLPPIQAADELQVLIERWQSAGLLNIQEQKDG
jgi:hypothetical protein